MARLEMHPEDLSAILVTHEHSDHIRGVAALARKFSIPIYATHGTLSAASFDSNIKQIPICCHSPFAIEEVEVEPVAVPHDAREPCQYKLTDGQRWLGVLTDLGSVTPFVRRCYQQLDALLLECNHDVAMLENGPYPHSVKRRIRSDFGHLSNDQAAEFAKGIDTSGLQHLVISHISQQNNADALALDALCGAIHCDRDFITVAAQKTGFAWREIS